MGKRRLESPLGSPLPSAPQHDIPPDDVYTLNDLPRTVSCWLEAMVAHYDALEWCITADGLQRTGAFPVSVYHGRPLPVGIANLIMRLTVLMDIDTQVVLVAAVYLSRLLERGSIPVSSCTVHRLLLVAIVVALKFTHDRTPSNQIMASVAGIETAELNKLEVKFLCGLGYNLRVSPSDMATAVSALRQMVEVETVGECSVESGMEDSDYVVESNGEEEIATNNYNGLEERSCNNYNSSAGGAASSKRRKLGEGEETEQRSNYYDASSYDTSDSNHVVGVSDDPESPGWSQCGSEATSPTSSINSTNSGNSGTRATVKGRAAANAVRPVMPFSKELATPERRGAFTLGVAAQAE